MVITLGFGMSDGTLAQLFFLLSLFVILSLYIFLHLTAMYSCTFGKRVGGWVGTVNIYWYECSFVVFSLRELTCMHCVSGAVNTQGFCVI